MAKFPVKRPVVTKPEEHDAAVAVDALLWSTPILNEGAEIATRLSRSANDSLGAEVQLLMEAAYVAGFNAGKAQLEGGTRG